MKRFIMMALLAAMVLSLVGTASAVELKVKGHFIANANWWDNRDFLNSEDDDANSDEFTIYQRVRLDWSFVANENVSGFLRLEEDVYWGGPGFDLAADNDASALDIERGYIDFRVPNSDLYLRAGLQGVALPGVVGGSPVLDDNAPGLIASWKLNDMVALSTGYLRFYDQQDLRTETNARTYDEFDAVFAAVPLTFEGVSVTPWGVYAWLGKDSGPFGGLANNGTIGEDTVNPWWVGLSIELGMFDPFLFKADAMYGASDNEEDALDVKGYWFDALFTYTGLDMMNINVFGVYASGDGDDYTDDGSGVMPQLSGAFSLPADSIWFADNTLRRADLDIDNAVPGAAGLWTVGAALTKISFLDKLTHDLQIAYIQGTNDEDAPAERFGAGPSFSAGSGYLTTKDYVVEVDFNHQYQIYEQLSAILNLGYAWVNADDDVWSDAESVQNTWRIGLGLVYAF